MSALGEAARAVAAGALTVGVTAGCAGGGVAGARGADAPPQAESKASVAQSASVRRAWGLTSPTLVHSPDRVPGVGERCGPRTSGTAGTPADLRRGTQAR